MTICGFHCHVSAAVAGEEVPDDVFNTSAHGKCTVSLIIRLDNNPQEAVGFSEPHMKHTASSPI